MPSNCGNDPRTVLLPGGDAEVGRFVQHLVEAKRTPTVVCICGSMRFQAFMHEHAEFESLQGHIVLMPHVNMKAWDGKLRDDLEGTVKARLDALHRAKIRMANEVLVVGNYVGESTTAEIEYARWLGLPIRFTHPEVDPAPKETPNVR